MCRKQCVCAIVCLALSVGLCAAEDSRLHMSSRQASRLARSANTIADFRDLARFYKDQATLFEVQAQEQRQIHDESIDHWGGKSYPRVAERARLLDEYYSQRAAQDRQLAESWERKAKASSAVAHKTEMSKE